MNTEPDRMQGEGDAVETALREMTAWKGPLPRPGLWERAVGEVEAGRAARARRGWFVLRARIPTALAAVLAIAVIGVLVTAMMPLGVERRSAASLSERDMGRDLIGGLTLDYVTEERQAIAEADAALNAFAPTREPTVSSAAVTPMDSVPRVERSVIHKATIEFKAAHVRVAAQKAAMLINEAGGEYVQESAVRGEGDSATAQIVLRVASSRLSAVLDGLRGLGEVADESASGTDVTGQVVDLEARLRNERRVEVELLELLEKREGAPLKEILDLREQIARVRTEVERLTAQRDQLSRLVSLATVLVIIRGGEASKQGSASILPYFGERLDAAWRSGVRTLADTLGFVVRIAVGGLPWWILAGVVLVGMLRWSARRRAVHNGERLGAF